MSEEEIVNKLVDYVGGNSLAKQYTRKQAITDLKQHTAQAVKDANEDYVKSIFRDRAKTNPDMTFKEYWERQYNQKHDYRGQ